MISDFALAELYGFSPNSLGAEEYLALKNAVHHINKCLQLKFKQHESSSSVLRSPQATWTTWGGREIPSHTLESYSSKKLKRIPKRHHMHLELSSDHEWRQERYGLPGKFSTRNKRNDPFREPARPNTSTNFHASKPKAQLQPASLHEKPGAHYINFLRNETKIQPTILLNNKLNSEVTFTPKIEPHLHRSVRKDVFQQSHEPSKDLKSFMDMKKVTHLEVRETPKNSVFLQLKEKEIRNKNKSMNTSNIDLNSRPMAPPHRVESAVLKKKSLPLSTEAKIFMPKKHSVTSAHKLPPHHLLKDHRDKEQRVDVFEQIKKAQKISQITEAAHLASPEEKHLNLLAKARSHLHKKKEQSFASSNLFKPLGAAGRPTPFRQLQH